MYYVFHNSNIKDFAIDIHVIYMYMYMTPMALYRKYTINPMKIFYRHSFTHPDRIYSTMYSDVLSFLSFEVCSLLWALYYELYFSKFDKDQTFIFVCQKVLLNWYQTFYDEYVEQLSLYKHDSFCYPFLQIVACRGTKTPSRPKIEVVTESYLL